MPGEVVHISSLNAVARQLHSRVQASTGTRTLVVGQTAATDPAAEAIELAEHLSRQGAQVVLIDWSAEGGGVAAELGIPTSPGMAELLKGTAGFEAVVRRVPGSQAQVIACGSGLVQVARGLDAGQINLLLDALDEVYQHIIVTGRNAIARQLFEAIEGRFDAGLLVAEAGPDPTGAPEAHGTFLGFEVSDLEVIRYQRGSAQPAKRGGARGSARQEKRAS